MFLTHKELVELTGKHSRTHQMIVLCHMGIRYRQRPDGVILVMREHIIKQFDGNVPADEVKRVEPNWAALSV